MFLAQQLASMGVEGRRLQEGRQEDDPFFGIKEDFTPDEPEGPTSAPPPEQTMPPAPVAPTPFAEDACNTGGMKICINFSTTPGGTKLNHGDYV